MKACQLIFSVLTLLTSISCTSAKMRIDRAGQEPFQFGNEIPQVVDQSILDQATKDFSEVLAGRNPIFAKFPEDGVRFPDGGTTEYKGNGYTLRVQKSIATVGKVYGYMYGPIVIFDRIIDSGPREISNIKFYSVKALEDLTDKNK